MTAPRRSWALTEDQVARTIRAMEHQFSRRHRQPSDMAFAVLLALAAAGTAVVTAPRLMETVHAGWSSHP